MSWLCLYSGLVKCSSVDISRSLVHYTSASNSLFSEVVSPFSTDAMPRRRHKVSPIHKCWRSAGTGGREGTRRREGRDGQRGRGERGAGRAVAEGWGWEGARERGEKEGRERGTRKGRMELPFGRLLGAINFHHLVSANSACTTAIPIVFLIFDHVTFKIKH